MRLIILIFTCFTLLFLLPAQAAEPLFVGEAKVDVMGESPENARDMALKQAKRSAIKDLFSKFVPSQESILMENLTDDQVTEMVREVKFVNEFADGNRFRADANVSVSATVFNKLIADKEKAVENDDELITTASLILPLFSAPERYYLFESKNPWGQEWKEVARNVGRGQLITPFGDSVDYSMINPRDTLTFEFDDFAPLLRRYGVRDVVVLEARLIDPTLTGDTQQDPNASKEPKILEVKERRVQAVQEELKTFEYVADANETDQQLFGRAARDLSVYIMKMQRDTIGDVASRKKERQSIMAIVPITTMQHFNWLRQKLAKVAGVELVEVLAIKPRQADLRIQFTGDQTILLDAMKTAGLHVENRTNFLEIRP